ncbi:hypothetical protein Tco_0871402, partial [Tanacetum coccineum]
AYVDERIMKGKTKDALLCDIIETFQNLKRIDIKLNPARCTLGVDDWQFLAEGRAHLNLAYSAWVRTDQSVRSWLNATLSVPTSYLLNRESAELDVALSKSSDSQSSIFFSPENVGLGEGFLSLLTSTDTDR